MYSKLKRGARSSLVWSAVLYMLIGVTYALVTPALEKPDEGGHYGYLMYLRDHRALPPLIISRDTWSFEYKQPPLYYAVTAALAGWIPDTLDLRQSLALNPYVWESVPGYRNDNRNRYLHPPDMTTFLLAGRLVSLLFGLGAMTAAYFLAAQLFDKKTLIPIATAAFVGFQPQFVYIATAANNDAATALWGTLAVTLLVYRLKKKKWAYFAALTGAVLGLASLTKVSGLVFFPLVGLGLLFIHRGVNRAFFRDGVIIATIALLVGGWWYARNAILYHDPLTLRAHYLDPSQSQAGPRLLKHIVLSVEYTFWANQSRIFLSPIAVDQALIGWGRVSLGLFILSLAFNHRSIRAGLPVGIVLLSWPIVFWILLVGYWNRLSPWAYGRLLFPAIAPIALLFAVGWRYAFPPRWQRLTLTLSVGMMIIAASLLPFVSLYPLYHPSREGQVEQVEHPVGITFVDETGSPVARLIGYNLPKPRVLPGQYLSLELCWEPLGRTPVPYTMFVQLLDLSQLKAGGSAGVWGRRMTYPGLGNRPTDRWTLHQAFCDTVLIQAFPETPTPLGAAIEVGFDDPEKQDRLQAVDAAGNPVDLALVGGVAILSPRDLASTQQAAGYTLDNAIGFVGAEFSSELKDSITLTLTWQSLRSVPYDATSFVHLRQADGSIVAQVDRQPLQGRFSTSYWLPGQVITDVVNLPLPPEAGAGPFVLDVGMYTWPSLQRLPATDAGGTRAANDVITIHVPLP